MLPSNKNKWTTDGPNNVDQFYRKAEQRRLTQARGIAQVAEHLPSKLEVLSSNPRTSEIKEATQGSIQLWYIVRTFINVTMYPQYNNNNNKRQIKKYIHHMIPFVSNSGIVKSKLQWQKDQGSPGSGVRRTTNRHGVCFCGGWWNFKYLDCEIVS
jgi:hypothetical protein